MIFCDSFFALSLCVFRQETCHQLWVSLLQTEETVLLCTVVRSYLKMTDALWFAGPTPPKLALSESTAHYPLLISLPFFWL